MKEDSIIKVTEVVGSTTQNVAYVATGLVERTTKTETSVKEKIYTKPNTELYGLAHRRSYGVIPPRKRIPMLTVKRPVWDGSRNVYKEITNVDYVSTLQKYYNKSSVIWLILECQRLLHYDVGTKEQPDINVVVIRSDIKHAIDTAEISRAYKILKTEGVITRVKPHHYMINPSFLLPYEAEDYHKAAAMWQKHTGEQLVK